MTRERTYNTNLSKAQGIIPETLELLAVWQPGMTAVELKSRVRETGALGKATQTRINDVVSRGFAQRYVNGSGEPARFLQPLARDIAFRGPLKQLLFLYTARNQRVLHDFVREVYWRKAASTNTQITKEETRAFLEHAKAEGRTTTEWSSAMTERVTRYLLGTLQDFEWIGANRAGQRKLRPPTMLPETILFLAYDLRFAGLDGADLVRHKDWELFGVPPAQVTGALEGLATHGHIQVQNAGPILRIEWVYQDMQSVIDAITQR